MADVTFSMDIAHLIREINGSFNKLHVAAKKSLTEIMNDWKAEAVDLAPLDKGTLRRGISKKIVDNTTGRTLAMEGQVVSVAIENSPKWARFNYAYYLHEIKGEIRNPTTSGTVAQYLDYPVHFHYDEWMQKLERDIKDALT